MTFSSSRKRSQSRVNRSIIYLIQFSSVTQLCPTLCDPMDCTTLGLPVHHQLTELCESIESVMPSNHLILCHPLLLLPSIFPSTRVFSNESALCIRWPNYWIGIPVDLFQILKDDAVKMLHSICQQIWKTQQWPQDGKGQFSFQSQRKAMPKNAQTTAQLHSSHMLVK